MYSQFQTHYIDNFNSNIAIVSRNNAIVSRYNANVMHYNANVSRYNGIVKRYIVDVFNNTALYLNTLTM